jgi:hypothetical protein
MQRCHTYIPVSVVREMFVTYQAPCGVIAVNKAPALRRSDQLFGVAGREDFVKSIKLSSCLEDFYRRQVLLVRAVKSLSQAF